MKTTIRTAAIVGSCFIFYSALGQGTLTPPAGPGPTMKSLDQIEARTPISAAPFTITASGSYYLTTNVTVSSGDAITISANNVTLDLNGFTISSTRPVATTETAILLNGTRTNISIYNGHISSGVTNTAAGVFGGSGFGNGISYATVPPYNARVKDMSISGMLYYGVLLNIGNSTVVESCTILGAGNYGIIADCISDSTAVNCGNDGIYASTAHNCKGSAVGSGIGVTASVADGCYGSGSAGGKGMSASTANNCFGYNSGNGDGLDTTVANNCYGSSVGNGYGLFAGTVANGCVGTSISGTGLSALIASVCHGSSVTGTPLNATHNVNSF